MSNDTLTPVFDALYDGKITASLEPRGGASLGAVLVNVDGCVIVITDSEEGDGYTVGLYSEEEWDNGWGGVTCERPTVEAVVEVVLAVLAERPWIPQTGASVIIDRFDGTRWDN